MADSSASGIGLLLAGFALIVAFLPWSVDPVVDIGTSFHPILAFFAGVATVAFSLRRHDRIDRGVGAPIAGIACVVVVAYGFVSLIAPRGGETSGFLLAPIVVMLVGSVAVIVAYADYRSFSALRLMSGSKVILIGGVLGVVGLLVGTLMPAIPVILATSFVGDLPIEVLFSIGVAFFGLGLILVSIGFVIATERGLSYFDFRIPSVYDGIYAIVGVFVLLAVAIAITYVYAQFNVPSSESSIERSARQEGPGLILWVLPLAWLAIGLGEELLFRNVVQKYFSEHFSVMAAIVASSVIFTLVHIPAYYSPNPLALTSTLFVVFSLSIILGVTFAKTENLIVPVFIHGTYNAIIFLAIFAQLMGGG